MKKILLILLSIGAGLAITTVSVEASAAECTTTDYLRQRPDVARDGYYGSSAYRVKLHYRNHGRFEGMCAPTLSCTPEYYLRRRPDVAAHPTYRNNTHWHYARYGWREGMCTPCRMCYADLR